MSNEIAYINLDPVYKKANQKSWRVNPQLFFEALSLRLATWLVHYNAESTVPTLAELDEN